MIKNERWSRMALIFVSIFLTVIGGEIILPGISHTDMDRNIYIVDRRIRPFQFPIKSLEKKLEHYKNQATSYTHYDPDLGWAVRPTSQSENSLYFSNSPVVRAPSSRQAKHESHTNAVQPRYGGHLFKATIYFEE